MLFFRGVEDAVAGILLEERRWPTVESNVELIIVKGNACDIEVFSHAAYLKDAAPSDIHHITFVEIRFHKIE